MSKVLVEKKEWYYYLYKEDDIYELKIPLPNPTPGFDVIYRLSDNEKEKYLIKGMSFLEERLKHMKEHYFDYALT